MDDLFAEQKAGREPSDPVKLFADAGNIARKYPTDKFASHAAWLESVARSLNGEDYPGK